MNYRQHLHFSFNLLVFFYKSAGVASAILIAQEEVAAPFFRRNRMIKIEVWSDINCPFCYIGKKHLESALSHFAHIGPVDLIWKSFELDPYSKPPKGTNNTDYLARKYGKDRTWAKKMNESMTIMAKAAGLHFNLDQVIVANSFDAHRLLQMAKHKALVVQDELNEKLFSYKFTEGKDISDPDVLRDAGLSVGLEGPAISEMLKSDQYSYEVRLDEEVAGALGIRAVPYFIFNKHISISGAKPVSEMINVLKECADFQVSRELD